MHTHRYQGLIVLAVAQSALATIITIICKIHIEPLTGKAAVTFAVQNFRYFGFPMLLILLAFANTIFALVVCTFGAHALLAGSFASCAFGLAMWCVAFVWGAIFRWKNKELSKKVRDQRQALHIKIFKTLSPFKEYAWLKKVCMHSSVYKEIFAKPVTSGETPQSPQSNLTEHSST